MHASLCCGRRTFIGQGLRSAAGLVLLAFAGRPPPAAAATPPTGTQGGTFKFLIGTRCQGCIGSARRFVSQHRAAFSNLLAEGDFSLVIGGKPPQPLPARSMALGRCASAFFGTCRLSLDGCPPKVENILSALRAYEAAQGKKQETP